MLGASAPDRRFVRAVTIDLKGRCPLADEWKAAFGKTREQFVREVAASESFWHGWYEELLFYFLLLDNFRPSTDMFAAIPSRLEQKQVTVRDTIRTVVSSQFFNARNPGNDTFVTVVLEQLLGMTVQDEKGTLEAGKKMYDGRPVRFLKRKGSSQADLVRIAVEDEAFERHLLARSFTTFFGEEADLKALRPAAQRLRQDPHCLPEIFADWMCSQAYEDLLNELRIKTDRQFVRCLFVDLLERTPTYQEFRRCRNALLALSDSGPLRNVVIKLVLDSGMAKIKLDGSAEDFVDRQFQQLLCRDPAAEERSIFVGELKKGVAPKTLVRALLTHWEYQHY